jgi:dTDP-4-amino-4,6-dideoxygalactose transaminase
MNQQQKIPFLDLKGQYAQIKDEVLQAVEEVFANTAFTNGFSVKNFEAHFADYCNTKHACAVNSGTSALHLAMRALDIGEGDEVILPANTFIASAWAPMYVKAKPVFVDCDPETWQIDPIEVQNHITKKTKAIMGVHLYGQPFDIDKIKTIAADNNLLLIEDAAQAHGATYKGNRIGGLGALACFSFYPGKNLGTYGEGGAITTNDEGYFNRIQQLKNHASVNKYYHTEEGYNMRMGGVEGAVLDIKLKYIDAWNNRRKEIAAMYTAQINNPKVKLQKQPEFAGSVYHLFVITVDDRTKFMEHLKANNIFPGIHYPVPCHLQDAFAYLGYSKGDIPNAEHLADHCVSLPMFPELTDQQVQTVIDCINKY